MTNTYTPTKFLFQLLSISNLLEEQTDLEQSLRDVATLTAQSLKTQRCSIMLLSESENLDSGQPYLQVFTHYGNLPQSAYQQVTLLNDGIAGHVAATGEPILVKDITQSEFLEVARNLEGDNKSLISAPIFYSNKIIGVINVTSPLEKSNFDEQDLETIELFALFIGKSIQIAQLQTILRSKFVGMAVAREFSEFSSETAIAINPNPNKLVKIVAKSFYRELTKAGFGANQIIEIATGVLDLLQKNIARYKKRLSRDDG
jgi:L-methionine (R)-S-oxide reductase